MIHKYGDVIHLIFEIHFDYLYTCLVTNIRGSDTKRQKQIWTVIEHNL